MPRFASRRMAVRAVSAFLVAASVGLCALAGPAGETPDADRTFTVECYYKAQWGQADEFIRLFRKNHLPVLKALIEKGRIVKVSAVRPRYHGTEDGRWDYRVTIVFKDAAVAHDASVEEAVKKQLFPNQETFKKEESRRFEILDAHWDIPVADVKLED
jgi:hypothetical protein